MTETKKIKRKPSPDQDMLRAIRRNIVAIQKANEPRIVFKYYSPTYTEQLEQRRKSSEMTYASFKNAFR